VGGLLLRALKRAEEHIRRSPDEAIGIVAGALKLDRGTIAETWANYEFRLHLGLHAKTDTFVQDRTIYEDAEIFATNLARSGKMSERDFKVYSELYDGMRRALQPPDLMIYLRCSVPGIRRRIKKRGRASEQAIPLAYLRRLNALYEDWMGRYDLSPKMVWESDDADYLTDLVDRIEFKRTLERFLAR
jgi:deoxyadenosine/deoxycytidine kinase